MTFVKIFKVLAGRIEGCLLLLARYLILSADAVTSCIAGVQHTRDHPEKRAIDKARWRGYRMRGVALYRLAWWPLFRYERFEALWWYLGLAEWFSIKNKQALDARDGQRFLIIQPAHLGDVLHLRPMVEALRKARPNAIIDVVVGPWAEVLVRRWPMVDRVWVYHPRLSQLNRGSRGKRMSYRSELHLLAQLRKGQYGHAISVAPMTPPVWALLLAVCPDEWIGCEHEIQRHYADFASKTVPFDGGIYEASRLMGFLALLDIHPPGPPRLEVDLNVAEQEKAFSLKKSLSAHGPFVVIAPGAGWSGRFWPSDRYMVLMRYLHEHFGAGFVLIGSQGERSYLDAMVPAGLPVQNLAGQTSFHEAAAVIAEADLFIGNDSAPFHAAVAAGVPVVGLFRKSQRPRWAPQDRAVIAVEADYDCPGCVTWHPRGECLHDHACIKGIQVDAVINACACHLRRHMV